MGTNTDTKLIEISPYMHQIGHSLNSREITRNVQEGESMWTGLSATTATITTITHNE